MTKSQSQTQVAPDTAKDLIKQHGTKSGAIRALNAQGKTRKEISVALGIRYQHVRNVLITPVSKPKVVETPKPEVQV